MKEAFKIRHVSYFSRRSFAWTLCSYAFSNPEDNDPQLILKFRSDLLQTTSDRIIDAIKQR